MNITVAICTWNRAGLLGQTLDAMTRLRIPEGVTWELLVVNNNCTDDTDQVTAAYTGRLPLRRLWELRPGKSNACNLAVREALGEYMLWTDDDVLVDPNWIAVYCGAFRRHPTAAVFGGRIDPWFAGTPPAWLREVFPRVAVAYAAVDHGDAELPMSWVRFPFGANMVIRTAEQRQHLYDPTLGPQRNAGLRGEETDVICSILKAGSEGWWVPKARVKHYIPPERQTVRFLRSWYTGYGRIFAREIDVAETSKWFGRPRWLWRKALERELCYRFRRLCGRSAQWVEDLIQASTAWGMLRSLGERGV